MEQGKQKDGRMGSPIQTELLMRESCTDTLPPRLSESFRFS